MHLLNNMDRRFEDGLDVDRLLAEAGAYDDPAWDGGYKFYFQRLRAWRRIDAKLKQEHVWIKNWHLPSNCRRKLPWFDEIVAVMRDATDRGAQVHERIYRDALRRAAQTETKGTQA